MKTTSNKLRLEDIAYKAVAAAFLLLIIISLGYFAVEVIKDVNIINNANFNL